jgi:hypothetical protein
MARVRSGKEAPDPKDPVLVAEGLCAPLTGHDDHAHIEVAPPPLG